MPQDEYIVEGRQFRTKADYTRALHDKKIIDTLRKRVQQGDCDLAKQLIVEIQKDQYPFLSILKEDFLEELLEISSEKNVVKNGKQNPTRQRGKGSSNTKRYTERGAEKNKDVESVHSGFSSEKLEHIAREELTRQERRRKLIILCSSMVAVICFGYLGVYSWYQYRTDNTYEKLSELKEKPSITVVGEDSTVGFTLDQKEIKEREVLEEYKNLLNKNKKLIGWVKIDDTNIDYPVMQTTDNEYYLDHNLNQEYDKNGSIFMDKDCNVTEPSTNYIIYGHHMKSGAMFGQLHLFEKEDYWQKHPLIHFDTIYEKGTYEIMYVFRSRVYSESEIVFKYYQFIDADSEQEFDSNMKEMAAMSYYDTGVTAKYGDQLLTLSTCDYQEKNGRFVVVAKKIKE